MKRFKQFLREEQVPITVDLDDVPQKIKSPKPPVFYGIDPKDMPKDSAGIVPPTIDIDDNLPADPVLKQKAINKLPLTDPRSNIRKIATGTLKKLGSIATKGGAAGVGTAIGDLGADAITSSQNWDEKMKSLESGIQSSMSGMSPEIQDKTITALDLAHDVVSIAKDPISPIAAVLQKGMEAKTKREVDNIIKAGKPSQVRVTGPKF